MEKRVEAECGVLEERGVKAAIARELGITIQAVSQWTRIPANRVLVVSRLTGIPPHELRPDLYPNPETENAA